MAQQSFPAIMIPPGEILKEELDARGLSQKGLAMIMARPEQVISEIINVKKQITPQTALELELALSISVQFWVNLEANYQLHLAQKQALDEAIARRRMLFELLPLKKMARRGWLQLPQDPAELERAVERYLYMNPLAQEPSLSASFRHSMVREPDWLATLAWLRRVERLAAQRQASPFDREALRQGIREILGCAERAEDVARLTSVLASFGISLALVPHLDKTCPDGAAFFLGDRGVIALTLRFDRIDSFWFTLLHEVAHLLERDIHSYLDSLPMPSRAQDIAEQPRSLWRRRPPMQRRPNGSCPRVH